MVSVVVVCCKCQRLQRLMTHDCVGKALLRHTVEEANKVFVDGCKVYVEWCVGEMVV